MASRKLKPVLFSPLDASIIPVPYPDVVAKTLPGPIGQMLLIEETRPLLTVI